MFNNEKEKYEFIQHNLNKFKTPTLVDKLFMLLDMTTQYDHAKSAINYVGYLDMIVDIYFHPNGKVAINGFKDNLNKYKVFISA